MRARADSGLCGKRANVVQAAAVRAHPIQNATAHFFLDDILEGSLHVANFDVLTLRITGEQIILQGVQCRIPGGFFQIVPHRGGNLRARFIPYLLLQRGVDCHAWIILALRFANFLRHLFLQINQWLQGLMPKRKRLH